MEPFGEVCFVQEIWPVDRIHVRCSIERLINLSIVKQYIAFQGDGGGGLICNNLVYGIVSGGFECGLPNFPGIYVDVAIYNTWIDSTISWNGGDHEIVPTPTPITTTSTPSPSPTTPSPGGGAVIVNSIYLFVVCITIVFLK